VAAVPALNNTGAETTVLELKRAGGRQYISRLWIEGKAYGYELPTPEAGSASTGASLQASYTPAPRPVEAAAAPAPEPAPARAEAPPAPAPQPEPPPAPQPEPVREPPPVEVPKPAEPPAMPETADGSIAGFLMSGSLLLLSGALLRPKPTS
jgi:hypothetical protein